MYVDHTHRGHKLLLVPPTYTKHMCSFIIDVSRMPSPASHCCLWSPALMHAPAGASGHTTCDSRMFIYGLGHGSLEVYFLTYRW